MPCRRAQRVQEARDTIDDKRNNVNKKRTKSKSFEHLIFPLKGNCIEVKGVSKKKKYYVMRICAFLGILLALKHGSGGSKSNQVILSFYPSIQHIPRLASTAGEVNLDEAY